MQLAPTAEKPLPIEVGCNGIEDRCINKSIGWFLSAISDVAPYGSENIFSPVGRSDAYLRSKLPRHELKRLCPRSNYPLLGYREILTSHLSAQKMQANVADDLVELPASPIRVLKAAPQPIVLARLFLLLLPKER